METGGRATILTTQGTSLFILDLAANIHLAKHPAIIHHIKANRSSFAEKSPLNPYYPY
jgi:hypothetical protein